MSGHPPSRDTAAVNAPVAAGGDLAADGHFTTMQVRDGAIQGLDLHLARLREATMAMFDACLDEGALRARLRLALEGDAGHVEARTLRVVVRAASSGSRGEGLDVGIDIEAPREPGASALRLRSHQGLRERAALKHLAIEPQFEARRAAQAAGFDDALLVDAGGSVAEGTFWNVAFWDGEAVVWPEAPSLDGVTQRLLQEALARAGVPQRRDAVRLDALDAFRAAFAINSRGIQAVASVDDHAFGGDGSLGVLLRELLAACPWQRP